MSNQENATESPQGNTEQLDEFAYHIANSKAYKFFIETGHHLRDSVKVDYQRKAKADLLAWNKATVIEELKKVASHNNSEYTSDYLEDRIKALAPQEETE